MISKIILFFIFVFTKAQSIYSDCNSIQCQTADYVCGISRDLIYELKSQNQNLSGWFHLNKKYTLPKNLIQNFEFIESSNGIDSYNSSCSYQNPLCPYNIWTYSDYPMEYVKIISNLSLCYTENFSNNSCISYCLPSIRVAYCSQYDSYSYFITPDILANIYKYTNSILCNGQNFTDLLLNNIVQIPSTASIRIVTTETEPSINIDEISLKCSFKCSTNTNCNQMNGRVKWFADNVEIYETILDYNETTQDLFSFLNETNLLQHFNKEFSCQVLIQQSQNESSLKISSGLFLGIKCDVPNLSWQDRSISTANLIQITINEGNTKPISLVCNLIIPILCKDRNVNECDLKIWINYRNQNNFKRIVTKECVFHSNGTRICDGCNKSFKKNSQIVQWDLNVNMESKNKNYQNEEYYLDIKTKYDPNLLKPIFRNLTVPSLLVKFIKKNRPLTTSASCFNDPHCVTFDRRAFELQQAGEYLMYENIETQTRVHLVNKLCAPEHAPIRPYCLNNVFIQSMNEVIKLDLENNLFYYSNLKIGKIDEPIIFENGISQNKFEQFFLTFSGYSIQVETGYGLVIKLYGWYYYWIERFVFSWMEINPSKADFGKIDGLFGNWNGNYNDDFVSIRNSNITAASESQIFESYRAGVNPDIPSFLNEEYYTFDEVAISEVHSYCDCLSFDPTISLTSFCQKSLNEKAFNKKNNSRSKRNAKLSVDLEAIAKSKSIQFVKSNGIIFFDQKRPKRQVVDASQINCNIESNLLPISNLTQFCLQDIKEIPQIPWDAGYRENVKTISIDILSNDVNQFIPSENGLVPNIELIKANCPKNCSNHGTCNDDGTCDCNSGYSQVDCSVKLSDPPKLIGLSTKSNAIDSSDGNPKDLIVSLARFVADNPDSNIRVSIHSPTEAKSLQEVISAELKGVSLNLQSTYVKIDTLTANAGQPWYQIKLSATNDGSTYSNPITLMVYPSKTHKCNLDADNFSCEKINMESIPSTIKSSASILLNQFTILLFNLFFLLIN